MYFCYWQRKLKCKDLKREKFSLFLFFTDKERSKIKHEYISMLQDSLS